MDDSPARVACAPAGTKRPVFIYPRAQAVSQEPPPPPSPRHQDGHLPPCRPQLSPFPAAGSPALLWHIQSSLPKEDGWCWDSARSWAAPPGPVLLLHPTRVSPPVRAGLQQLSPGSISSLDGCGSSLDGCGSRARALCRSVRGAHPKHTFGLWDLCAQHSAVLQFRVTQAGRWGVPEGQIPSWSLGSAVNGLIYVWRQIITALSSSVRQTGPAEPHNTFLAPHLSP